MTPINETEQPVKAAITEADVVAFFAANNKIILAEFPEADLSFFTVTNRFVLSSYERVHIHVNGVTVAEAISNYRARKAELVPSSKKLRSEAAALLAEAVALEAKEAAK
jgi:hypothetical protein